VNGSGGCSDGVSGVMGAMSIVRVRGGRGSGTVLPYLRDVYGTMRWEAHVTENKCIYVGLSVMCVLCRSGGGDSTLHMIRVSRTLGALHVRATATGTAGIL
jgi:hypothetical protein